MSAGPDDAPVQPRLKVFPGTQFERHLSNQLLKDIDRVVNKFATVASRRLDFF